MQKILMAIGMGSSLLLSASAMAAHRYADDSDDYSNRGLYFGGSAGEFIYKEDGIDTLNPTVAEFHIGQQFSPYIAVEARVGTGISDDESHGFNAKVEAIYGAYAKGILPFSPWVSGYALAGIGGARIHRNYPDYHTNDAHLSYGLGAAVNLGGGAALNLEWLRVTSGTNDQIYDYTADQLTFGVTWHVGAMRR